MEYLKGNQRRRCHKTIPFLRVVSFASLNTDGSRAGPVVRFIQDWPLLLRAPLVWAPSLGPANFYGPCISLLTLNIIIMSWLTAALALAGPLQLPDFTESICHPQAAFLSARTFPDGRTFFSSLGKVLFPMYWPSPAKFSRPLHLLEGKLWGR